MKISSFLSAVITKLGKGRVIAIGLLCAVAVIALSSSVYALMQDNRVVPSDEVTAADTKEDPWYRTVTPQLVDKSTSLLLLGSVVSHETANIYPRRDGIIEDIYVDIGDTVRKGQTVALLLPKGVEGQSAAMIGEKKARVQQAESDLRTAEQVAKETVDSAQRKIDEKQTELMIAKREQDQMLQKFAEYEDNITQLRDQAFVAVRNAGQTVESIVMGGNSRGRATIEEYEMLEDIGRLNADSMNRVRLVGLFNELQRLQSEFSSATERRKSDLIGQMTDKTVDLLNQTSQLLQTTPTASTDRGGFETFTYAELSAHVNKVTATTDMVLKTEDKFDDAVTAFAALRAAEPELYSAYFSGDGTGRKSNKVHMLESQIATAKNSLNLTEANQEQMIESRRSSVDIANAMLQTEYAQSGHRTILSPFSGTVSKRFADVGQIVMPSMPVFELTDVPTSLAKKAKAEIRFGLPEQLIDSISVGDTVLFSPQSDEGVTHEAVVTRKSPQVDMQTHTVTVQAKISDELKLPHQSNVRVRLTDDKTPLFKVPSSAVKREDERNILWVLDEQTRKPVATEVSVAAEDGEFAELTGSLSTGSLVILDPPDLFLSQ